MNLNDNQSKEKILESIESKINACDTYFGPLESEEWLLKAVSKQDVLFLLSLAKESLKK